MTIPPFAQAQTMDAASIPVIDISAAMDGSDIALVATEIHKAASEIGFFYIKGHGIEPSLIDQAFAVAKGFFDLPVADKETVQVDRTQRGWMATGMSRLQGSKTHDLKEVFFWGAEVAADDPDVIAGRPLVAVNQWPNDVFPRLQTELRPYYEAVCRVGAKVLSAIAVSLDAAPDFFESRYVSPLARGQLVYYPPTTSADEAAGRFGVSPHTDFGALTLLLQDQSGGLQVRTRGGVWIEAPPIEGTSVTCLSAGATIDSPRPCTALSTARRVRAILFRSSTTRIQAQSLTRKTWAQVLNNASFLRCRQESTSQAGTAKALRSSKKPSDDENGEKAPFLYIGLISTFISRLSSSGATSLKDRF